MKYTKGPWKVIHEFNVQQAGTRRGIASCGDYTSNGKDRENIYNENISNAHLIAAAPDMYEVLKAIICDNTKFIVMPDYLADKIQQALAKAEGK